MDLSHTGLSISSIPLVSLLFVVCSTYADTAAEVAKHLELGNAMLAKAQYGDALTHYHAAIELDPNNHVTYYRRATVYLAMGRSKSAIPDLNEVIRLKPDITAARIQRANILLKQGDLDNAESDFNAVLSRESSNEEAERKVELIDELRQIVNQGKTYCEAEDYHNAEAYLNHALEHMIWDPTLYRLRAKALAAQGNARKAITDLRHLTKLVPDSTDVYFEISKMYYDIGEAEESLTQIRECLKLNPDHNDCFPFYKRVKKLAKMRESLKNFAEKEEWMSCLEKGQQIMKTEPQIMALHYEVYKVTCKCNAEAGHSAEAVSECSEYLENVDERDIDVLCDRAEAYLADDNFDEAIEDYKKANEYDSSSRRAKEGLEKAQRLKNQAGKRDYYKILDVKRNANKREITKAYRKLAQKWHPDNFSDDKEKKKAEAKFIDIAAAKEVLTDEEKRRQFDQGVDPLDPQAQQGGGHHHHHGFNGFPHGFGGGDGGYSFKFNF